MISSGNRAAPRIFANQRFERFNHKHKFGFLAMAEPINSHGDPLKVARLRRDFESAPGIIRHQMVTFSVGSVPLSVRVNNEPSSFKIISNGDRVKIILNHILSGLPPGFYWLRFDIEFCNVTLRRYVKIDFRSRGQKKRKTQKTEQGASGETQGKNKVSE